MISNIHAHYRLAKAIAVRTNTSSSSSSSSSSSIVGGLFLIITASQFHLPFYISRMLPNTFALLFITHAYTQWFYHKYQHTLMLLVATTAIFRCDVIILLFTIGLVMLIQRKVTLLQAIHIGILTGVISLLLTIPLDSLLWNRIVWPEGEVLFFNTVQNKSSDYGTSPWYWYFVSAIPKGMLGTVLLVPFAFLRLSYCIFGTKTKTLSSSYYYYYHHMLDLEWSSFYIPIIGFVGLYSFLPHKEIRFIFIALPMINIMAAKGLESIYKVVSLAFNMRNNNNTTSVIQMKVKNDSNNNNNHRYEDETKGKQMKKTTLILLFIIFMGGLGTIVISFIGSSIFVSVSNKNYPGGQALRHLIHMIKEGQEKDNNITTSQIRIYVDVASAMTGVSLFGQTALTQLCPTCTITKGGYETHTAINNKFDFILSEDLDIDGFQVIESIPGNPKLNLKEFRIDTDNAIFILKRLH